MSLTGMAQVITGINQLIEVTGRIASFAAKPVEIVQNLINAADEAGRAAQKLGFASVEAFSKFQHAANMADVSNESFTAGVKNLDKALAAAAANPMSETAQAFAAIGFSAVDAAGKLKTPEQSILELSDRFAGFTDDANKSSLALKIFGRAGIEMIPMLNMGAAAIREAGAEIDGIGKDESEQAKQFNENLKRLHAVIVDMGNTIVKALLPYLSEFSAWLVKLQKDSGFFAAVAGTIIDVLKWLAVAAYDVYITFKILGTIIGSVAAAVSLEFDSSIRASVQLVGIWFSALKGIGSQLLNVAKTAGTAAQAMMKFATGDYLAALDLAKKGASDFGKEAASVGKIISGAVVDSGNVMLDKYAKDFADAKAIAKGAAKDIAADLIKLGTFTLDIFSPKTPKPQEAPFEKQPTPGVPDQAWLAAIEKSRKEAADLDRQFNLAVIEGIDRARLAEQYRFDDEQKQIKSLTIDEMQKNALLEKAYAAHQVAMTKIEKQGVDSRRALNIQAMDAIGGMFGSLSTLAQTFGKRGFEMAKGFSYAQAVINVAEGATKALAQGGFLGIVMMAAVLAAGAAQIATIANAKPQGVAHGGLDFVPGEQTFLLQRGERVIQPKANRDLTDFLSNFSADAARWDFGITPLQFSGSRNNGSQTGEWIGTASSDSNESGRVIELSIDGYKIGRVLWELSRNGRLQIAESAVRSV